MIGAVLREKTRHWRSGLSFPAAADPGDCLSGVSALLEGLEEFLRTVPGLDAGGVADLRLVCDEIASNVVRHVVPGIPVRLDVEVEAGEGIRLRMVDDGGEFNPFAQARPYLGPDLQRRKIGGLGLFLIRQLFPLARFQRLDGRNVTEVEYHPGEGGKEKMQRGGGPSGMAH